MPNENDDPGQPLWQSVLIFCCKGMIEGIIVLLFMWLLIQVLFTKHLEVHLQVLLGVGLVCFFSSLILGCILCWQRSKLKNSEDKEDMTSCPPPPVADHMILGRSPSLSSGATPTQVQYDKMEGGVLNYPPTFESSTPSDDDFATMPLTSRPRTASDIHEPKSCFPVVRRLSSPSLSSPLYRPMASGRSSLPSFPKFGLLSKTQKMLKRHFTVSGNTYPTSDSIMLTTPSPVSPCTHSISQTQSLLVDKSPLPNYGSNFCRDIPDPMLHFTLTFSPAKHGLTISLLSLTGMAHGLEGVTVQASLIPLFPGFLEESIQHCSLNPDLHGKSLVLQVNSLEDLHGCTLHLVVFTQDITGAKVSLLGRLEVQCGRLDWTSERPIVCTRALR